MVYSHLPQFSAKSIKVTIAKSGSYGYVRVSENRILPGQDESQTPYVSPGSTNFPTYSLPWNGLVQYRVFFSRFIKYLVRNVPVHITGFPICFSLYSKTSWKSPSSRRVYAGDGWNFCIFCGCFRTTVVTWRKIWNFGRIFGAKAPLNWETVKSWLVDLPPVWRIPTRNKGAKKGPY